MSFLFIMNESIEQKRKKLLYKIDLVLFGCESGVTLKKAVEVALVCKTTVLSTQGE